MLSHRKIIFVSVTYNQCVSTISALIHTMIPTSGEPIGNCEINVRDECIQSWPRMSLQDILFVYGNIT